MKVTIICLNILTLFLLTACGYKAPPEPFFATSPSNIQKEIDNRKTTQEQ